MVGGLNKVSTPSTKLKFNREDVQVTPKFTMLSEVKYVEKNFSELGDQIFWPWGTSSSSRSLFFVP